MKRGDLILSSAIVAIASLGACGGGGGNPDAMLVHDVDAGPPDAPPPPDAFVCTMTSCPDGTCDDLTNDPLHCGACDNPCNAGEVCTDMVCSCPTYDFIPPTVANGLLEQVLTNLPGAYVAAIGYLGSAEFDALAVGYSTDPTMVIIGMPYPLDATTLPNPPFVAAGYDIDVNTMMPRAAFVATSGTVTFDHACSSGADGTVTGATFQAGTLIPPAVDPAGCTFTVESVHFTIGDVTTAECNPPPT